MAAFDIAATLAASEVIDVLIDRTVAIIYDRQLAARELDFALQRSLEDAAAAVNSRLPVLDALLDLRREPEHRVTRFAAEDLALLAHAGSWVVEEEPAPPPIDSWAGSVKLRAAPARRLGAAAVATSHCGSLARRGPTRRVGSSTGACPPAGRGDGRHRGAARVARGRRGDGTGVGPARAALGRCCAAGSSRATARRRCRVAEGVERPPAGAG